MPHILMILDKSFPPDLRVENEARTLVDAGYEVSILAIGPDKRSGRQNWHGTRIIRDRIGSWPRNKMRGLSGFLPLMDWYLGWRLSRLYRENPFDAIHAHDLYLFGPALRVGRKLGVKVVGDMHENWVDALGYYRWSTTFPGKLFANRKRWTRLETQWTLGLDHVIVVIAEMHERLVRSGIPPEHISVVPNTVRLDEFDSWPVEDVFPGDGRTRILYTGGMDGHRGLEDAVRAMRHLRKDHPEALLVLVGDGAVREQLEEMAREEGVSDTVVFEGWQPQKRIKSYLHGATIGIIPHRKIVQNDHGMPHKLFHYMRMGLPVVVSDCAPLQRTVRDAGCGLIYASGDSAAMAAALGRLLEDSGLRENLGASGRRAVLDKYNWRATAQPLVDCYRTLFAS